MAYTVQEFCEIMEKLAPLELAFEWDNVGLQIGDPQALVSTVLVTLTVTQAVLEKALANKVDLIIAHHPLIFKPLQKIRTDEPQGSLLATILKNNLAVYISHTNLDQAPQGLNHWLARDLKLQDVKVLIPSSGPGVGLGRLGTIRTTSLEQLAQDLETFWGVPIRIVGDPNRTITTVAAIGGSGGDFVWQAKAAGAHVLITGDVSYHDALDAESLDLALLDAGHFATEQVMVEEVARYLRNSFESYLTIIKETSANPFRF